MHTYDDINDLLTDFTVSNNFVIYIYIYKLILFDKNTCTCNEFYSFILVSSLY